MQNVGSGRYAYVNDNTGGVDFESQKAEMGAVVLRDGAKKDRYCDPASVCYIKKVAHKHDVIGQNTSLYGIAGQHYVQFQDAPDGESYLITPLLRFNGKDTNIYLSDGARYAIEGVSYVDGKSTTGDEQTNNLYWWNLFPVDFSGDEYLGIKPEVSMQSGSKFYKPYVVGFDMQLSAGMKAYYITDVKDDAVIIAEYEGAVVPANMPVIIECSSVNANDNRVTLCNGDGSKYTPAADNKLQGQYFCYEDHGPTAYRVFDSSVHRVLSVVDGKLSYVTGEDASSHTTSLFLNSQDTYCINANESFLQVERGTADNLRVMTATEYKNWKNNGAETTFPDVHEDGVLNLADVYKTNDGYAGIVAMILKLIDEKWSADVDKNGKISIADVCKLIKKLQNGQTTFGE